MEYERLDLEFYSNPNRALTLPNGIIDQIILGCKISRKIDKKSLIFVKRKIYN